MGKISHATRKNPKAREIRPDRRFVDPNTGKRLATFKVRDPTEEDVRATRQMLDKESRTAGYKNFQDFLHCYHFTLKARLDQEGTFRCECNGDLDETQRAKCRCSAILSLDAQWNAQGLGHGTMGSYWTNVLTQKKMNFQRWMPQEMHLVTELRDVHQAFYAMAKGEDGTAVGIEQGQAVLDLLTAKGMHDAAAVLFMQAAGGPRCSCLSWLVCRDVKVMHADTPEQKVRLDLNIRKNGTDPKDAHTAYIKPQRTALQEPRGYQMFLEDVKRHKQEGTGAMLAFPNISSNKVDDLLRQLQIPYRTKSFRKHFAAMVMAETNSKEEVGKQLGQSNPKHAQFYLTLEGEEVVEEYRAMIELARAQ